MKIINVAVVEDDEDIRFSLQSLINSAMQFKCTQTYADCGSALAGIIENPPDVVLMDIGLPGMSGIEGTRRIKEKLPEIDILMLTVHENDEYVFEALCSGACGYLIKDTPPAKILEAIKDAIGGGAPMSTQIARMVVQSFQKKPSTSLTQRETEVLGQLCTGKSYKMIGDRLFISEETVRRHLKSIYKKLEVHSKSEAVAKAIKEKLV